MTLYRFSLYDKRIDAECQEALPNYPHVAHYIAVALRANDGSVLVARLLCEGLLKIVEPREVSKERADAFARMQRERRGFGTLRKRLSAVDHAFMDRQIGFMRQLRETMERENKITKKEGQRPDPIRFRPAYAIKKGEEAHTLFTTIFNAAYAMLSDVPIELTHEVAA